ncbi:MAG: SMI1/KNR4 family protein [Endozoicomonas sp.]|uniref:SMI1/KNR4 family protein n=1 Tax=Endozoicomonas sp. TaxID=1892382 RepID=UPI003D9B5FBD
MKDYSALIDNVKKADNELFWLGSASSDQINKLEKILEVKLPESFRQFLSEYGGGGIIDAEISGIEDNHAALDNGGTVFGDTLTAREDYELPENLIVVFFKDYEICWCLDSSSTDNSGEYPVVSYNLFHHKVDNKIADSFSDFFKDYLELRA